MAGLIDGLRTGADYSEFPTMAFLSTVRANALDDVVTLLRSDETREAIAEALAEWMDDYHDSAALAVVRVLTGEACR